MDKHYLTVGGLREKLDGLPDNMPVFYEHIEDSYMWKNGWLEHAVRVPDDFERDDKHFDGFYHRAFTAFVGSPRDSKKKCLFVTAHY